jgi:CRISPR-associated endonuclease/helicase Cas3
MQNKEEKDPIHIRCLWEKFSESLSLKEVYFQKLKTSSQLEETIRILRQDVWMQCRNFSKAPTGIYTLTVPTGGGKTLSSLRLALDHAIINEKKRILYVLPFTSIIEQNASVVREVLNTGDYLLEHHSNVVNETAYGSDDYEYRKLLTEQWTSPIIFTTMVQFLNTFFAGGTQDIRRFHNLTDCIIIFDEIQALPVKCISLFNETVNFLSNLCRDTIILCSATQPSLGMVKHKVNINKEIIKDVDIKFEEFKRMEIIDERYGRKFSVPKLSEFIYCKKQENDTILIILNTKAAAERVYLEVKQRFKDDSILFYYLSTNLCANHRKSIIREMKEALSQNKQVICVSTQLIEAGVDISFSCVIRHIAGLDSIAQASGRGNRNGEGAIKQTYIIELEDERLGSLKEIRLGEQFSGFVLDEYASNMDRFDRNLLSPKAIKRYYEHFFWEEDIERMMDYPVHGYDNTIYNMLSHPNKSRAYKNAYDSDYPLKFEYQFKTAAHCFEVIDEAAKSVLVPYKEGKSIISKLYSREALPDIGLIRSAQQYMVNISMRVYDLLI